MKIMSWLLSICFMSQVVLATAMASITKSGLLAKDEVWCEPIYLEGDVVVPVGVTLEIKPGILIYYAKSDVHNYGSDPHLPELVVYGTLKMDQSNYQILPMLKDDTRVIHIEPYQVDTKILRDEFSAFKTQYAILWPVMVGILTVAIVTRFPAR